MVVTVLGRMCSSRASWPGRAPGCSASTESSSSWATASGFRGGDPGAAAQGPAQPGDALGQPVGPGTGTAAACPRPGGHRGTAPVSRPPARTDGPASADTMPGPRCARAHAASAAMAAGRPGGGMAQPRGGVQRQRHHRHPQGGPQSAGHVHHPAGRRPPARAGSPS